MSNESKLELKRPKLFSILETLDADLFAQVKMVARIAEDFLERIPSIFPTFTMHNIEHSIRILDYIYEVIDTKYIPTEPLEHYEEHLSPLEICVIIYGALLHDIGMTPNEEINEMVKLGTLEWHDDKYVKYLEKYNGDEVLALQDYIRKIHAQLSSLYVKEQFGSKLHIPNEPAISYAAEVADLCESHNQNISWISNSLTKEAFKGKYKCNFQYCALLIRLGDILDFDSRRTPYHLFESIHLGEYSENEWRQHLVIESTGNRFTQSQTFEGWKTPSFYGKCYNPSVYRKVLAYFDWIEDEVLKCKNHSFSFYEEKYHIKLIGPLFNQIQTIDFYMANQQLKMDYEAITNLLMGEKIYGERLLGIRELVQNAIDACLLRLEMDKNRSPYDDTYIPKISIILDRKLNKLVIKDNGTGMNEKILNEYFLNIGNSYYKSDDFLLKDYKLKAIGNFGIGFLACFMLSDNVKVKTKYYNESAIHELDIEKSSKYIVHKLADRSNFTQGTEISLEYDFEVNPLDISIEKLKIFIETNFLIDNSFIFIHDTLTESYVETNTSIVSKLEKAKKNSLNKHSVKIDLTPYFKCITGVIKINFEDHDYSFFYNNSQFFKDIKFDEALFLGYYDGKDFSELNDENIKYCLNDYKLVAYQMYIVTNKEKSSYNKYLDVLEDAKSVYQSKFESFNHVVFFVDNRLDGDHFKPGYYDEESTLIDFNDLSNLSKKYGHVLESFFLEKKIIDTLFIERDDSLIKIDTLLRFYYQENSELFIRNVFIKNFIIDNDFYVHDAIQMTFCCLNCSNELIQPNVSRNDIDAMSNTSLQYALLKFIHLVALDYYKNNNFRQNQIKHVLECFYSEKSPLLNYEEINEFKFGT